jgi:2-keto-4-pentenoate hydratase/2-oxohepta-3-ene-1,7-dioic acid hydratase in catechol pathway
VIGIHSGFFPLVEELAAEYRTDPARLMETAVQIAEQSPRKADFRAAASRIADEAGLLDRVSALPAFSTGERGKHMRLARIGSNADIAVYHRGRWLWLTSLRGYENVTRIGDIAGKLGELRESVERHGDDLDAASFDLEFAATVADRDADIWGAGLNYRRHSEDLNARQPGSGPGSYLRPANCLIGNGGHIELPAQSERVTAEAELGLVIGTACKNVSRDDWRSVVAGVTAVLDMTAEDVILENPRYIPWAKGFDTFCSVGPVLVTLDEFGDGTLGSVSITTIRNGEKIASATPADMKYDLGYLVEYFTAGRTLAPGTVICTGTPGAAVINPGDTVQAVVEHVGTLTHPVREQRPRGRGLSCTAWRASAPSCCAGPGG